MSLQHGTNQFNERHASELALSALQLFCTLQTVRAEAKDIIFDQDSRKRMQNGINKLADAVGVTLGPRGPHRHLVALIVSGNLLQQPVAEDSHPCSAGRNVVLQQSYGVPLVRHVLDTFWLAQFYSLLPVFALC